MTDSPVISTGSLDLFDNSPPQGSPRFGASVNSFGKSLGLGKLGAMYVEVAPGKRAFPFHNHLGNDEMFVILEGTGTYRFGGSEHPVKAGDVCGAPHGGPDTAHQLINTGTTILKYLGISTTQDPEIAEYPDSGKFGAFAIAPGESFLQAHLKVVARREDSLDYWDGEE